MSRIHNFSAGPAVLPLEVLQRAQQELTDFRGCGMSIMEVSHRGPEYIQVDASARERLFGLLDLKDDYEIMFLQGGASMQFVMVPFNFLGQDQTADYIATGTWSKKAIQEAKGFGNVHIAFSSEQDDFTYVPTDDQLNPSVGATYTHYTSNNTIFGTEFEHEPLSDSPLVCDASSNFLSKPIQTNRHALIYAGAQKNIGPAGVTIVVVNKEFLSKAKRTGIPTFLQYASHVGEMYNTPPVFCVYMVDLVLEWIENHGGLVGMEKLNKTKADLLYQEIDRDDFYRGTAQKNSRSRMNVTFRLNDTGLENAFVDQAASNGLSGLKGHRSVGGMRASLYNACPVSAVEALIGFMQEFRRTKG